MTNLTRRGALVLVGAALLSACATTAPMTAPGATNTVAPDELSDEQILVAINAVRAANGAPAWSYNSRLAAAARSQAKLMAARNKLSHNLGVTLRERVTAAGYLGAVGENVAGGHPNLESAIQGWMNSPGHRSTLLSPKFTEFGLSVARTDKGRLYWAMIAGGPFQAWLV